MLTLHDGTEIEFHAADNWVIRLDARQILSGKAYPLVPEATDVGTILDVGANHGAASVFLARSYPEATIHAFEPASEPYGYLARNAEAHPGVHAHHLGLFDRDAELPLYRGVHSTGSSSIHASDHTSDDFELITLRSARSWVTEAGIDRIDILKIDTEGCEVQVLTDLAAWLPAVQVIYLEFHSVEDRAAIDELLAPTHELVSLRQLVEWQGEVAFARRDLVPADRPGPTG